MKAESEENGKNDNRVGKDSLCIHDTWCPYFPNFEAKTFNEVILNYSMKYKFFFLLFHEDPDEKLRRISLLVDVSTSSPLLLTKLVFSSTRWKLFVVRHFSINNLTVALLTWKTKTVSIQNIKQDCHKIK